MQIWNNRLLMRRVYRVICIGWEMCRVFDVSERKVYYVFYVMVSRMCHVSYVLARKYNVELGVSCVGCTCRVTMSINMNKSFANSILLYQRKTYMFGYNTGFKTSLNQLFSMLSYTSFGLCYVVKHISG
jgi:hypothetical protein